MLVHIVVPVHYPVINSDFPGYSMPEHDFMRRRKYDGIFQEMYCNSRISGFMYHASLNTVTRISVAAFITSVMSITMHALRVTWL